VTLKPGLWVTQGHRKLYYSIQYFSTGMFYEARTGE